MTADARGLTGMQTLLELRDVSVAYDGLRAVEHASFSVGEGEAVALLGANGAGKSTLLKTVAGLLRPSAGEIRFAGQPIHTLAPHHVARLGVMSVPEGRRIFPGLTVEENLLTGLAARPRGSGHHRDSLEEIFGWLPWLRDRRRQLGWALSGGEQQMVAIARALLGKPRLLLLDEPSLGLSPAASANTFEFISQIHARGVALLLVEQNAAYALACATRALVLEQGRVVLEGASEELRSHPLVRKAYLAV